MARTLSIIVTMAVAVLALLAWPAAPALADEFPPPPGSGDLTDGDVEAETGVNWGETFSEQCEISSCVDPTGASVNLDEFSGGQLCFETGNGHAMCDTGAGDMIAICIDAEPGAAGSDHCSNTTADDGVGDGSGGSDPGSGGSCTANYDDIIDSDTGDVIGTTFTGWSYPSGVSTTWTEGPGWFFNGGNEYWGIRTSHYACNASGNVYRTHYTHNATCYIQACVNQAFGTIVPNAEDTVANGIPDLRFNPEVGVVHVDTWMWDAGDFSPRTFMGWHPSAPVGAQVTTTPLGLLIENGDGGGVACEGPGIPWSEGAPGTDCYHTYTWPSLGTGIGGADNYLVEAARLYDFTCNASASGASSGFSVPGICGTERLSDVGEFEFIVQELQSVNR